MYNYLTKLHRKSTYDGYLEKKLKWNQFEKSCNISNFIRIDPSIFDNFHENIYLGTGFTKAILFISVLNVFYYISFDYLNNMCLQIWKKLYMIY